MSSIGRAPPPSPEPVEPAPVRLTRAEAEEAGALLKAEARDGRITRSEIRKAEAQIARKYGPEKARAILVSALGQDPAKVDFEAVSYLQGRVGSMNGHIKRYQEVLLGHLEKSKLLDSNFDGKLDKDDLIFTKDAAGKVNVQRIGQALRDRVLIGSAMVDASHAMADARHEFGDLRANPKYFRTEGTTLGTMFLKRGAKPSEAIRDIFQNPQEYQFECATALVVLRYKAMLDLNGERDFDRVCKDLKIGPWVQENDAAAVWKIRGEGRSGKVASSPDVVKKDLKPGDYTYFKNWSVSLAGYNAGWQGENVISLGKGKYYGHPFGITTGEETVAYLNEHRRTTGTVKSASLLDLRASVDPRILKLDKNPG